MNKETALKYITKNDCGSYPCQICLIQKECETIREDRLSLKERKQLVLVRCIKNRILTEEDVFDIIL